MGIYVRSEEQKKLGFYDFFSRLSPEMREWWENIVSPLVSLNPPPAHQAKIMQYKTELDHFLDGALGANVCGVALLLQIRWHISHDVGP